MEPKTNEDKKKLIIEKLKEVYDPEIPLSVWELGLIYKLEVKDDKVNILMTLTSPECPLSNMIIENIKEELEELDFIDRVNVELTFDPPWTPDMIRSEEEEEEQEEDKEESSEKRLNLPGSNSEEVDEKELKSNENVIDVDEKVVKDLFHENETEGNEEGVVEKKIKEKGKNNIEKRNKTESSKNILKENIVDAENNIESNEGLKFCHSCGKNENEVILLEGYYNGEKIYLCIDCLLTKFNDKKNKDMKKEKTKKN